MTGSPSQVEWAERIRTQVSAEFDSVARTLRSVALRQGRLFGPLDPAETPMTTPLAQAIVTAWGHWRGEAMLLLGRE